MWFKNLLIYQLQKPWTLTAGHLEELLAKRPLLPCSAMSTSSAGWVPPIDDVQIVQGLQRHLLIAFGWEQKLLPSSVIRDAVRQRAIEFEREKGFAPGRKQRRDFAEIVSAELLPRAFPQRGLTRAWIDAAAGRLIVDSSSIGRAEALVEALRTALGELSVTLPQTELSPAQKLTDWLSVRKAPGRFDLGEECVLSGTGAARAVIRYQRHNLDVVQIQRHLEEGLRARSLALFWNAQLSLIVNDKLEIKRLKFLDLDEAIDDPGLDPARQFESEFTLFTGQCSPMLDELLASFQ
ncbi:recombination-associated protein RdgC [Hydrocarboniphaga effusa]|uniref:recombination-associated protein RdgC n=1 Tax=Hydrocarboniphaga effusa TaxID=243629 RepID=UPI003BAA15B4